MGRNEVYNCSISHGVCDFSREARFTPHPLLLIKRNGFRGSAEVEIKRTFERFITK